MDKVIQNFDVKEVWLSGNTHTSSVFERTIDAILSNDIAYHEPTAGESFVVGSSVIEIVHPKELTNDLNNDSVSMRITYGETAFLFYW